MKKIILFAVAICFLGCSAFKPSTQPVKFTCEPKDVTLVVNGKRHDCPTTIEAQRNLELSVEGYKDGFLPYKRVVSYHMSETAYLDIVGTCIFLLPVFGLMTPGARDLDETDIHVILVKP